MSLDSDHARFPSGDLTSGVYADHGCGVGSDQLANTLAESAAVIRQSLVGTSINGRSLHAAGAANPVVATPPSTGTYEVKFVIDEAKGRLIREWSRQHLQPDPYSTPDLGYGYWVNSLYLDTPNFDVYRRGEGFRQRKYRLRRYGSESKVWMELKRKTDGQVHKRRVHVSDADLLSRVHFAPDATWEGHWFQNRLQTLQLRPVCQVTYQRFACVGTSSTGPFRLTIDSNLSSCRADGWAVPIQPLESGQLLPGQQILELKFREAVPALFRGLIEDHRLTLGAFSKYRQSVDACIHNRHT